MMPIDLDRTIKSSHFAPLDGLRGLAILAVILAHAYAQDGSGLLARVLNSFARSGWVGVTLFFVLSGYLITGILLDSRGERGWYRNFLARRTLRIFPALLRLPGGLLVSDPALALGRRASERTDRPGCRLLLVLPRQHAGGDRRVACRLVLGPGAPVVARRRGAGLSRLAHDHWATALADPTPSVDCDCRCVVGLEIRRDAPAYNRSWSAMLGAPHAWTRSRRAASSRGPPATRSGRGASRPFPDEVLRGPACSCSAWPSARASTSIFGGILYRCSQSAPPGPPSSSPR